MNDLVFTALIFAHLGTPRYFFHLQAAGTKITIWRWSIGRNTGWRFLPFQGQVYFLLQWRLFQIRMEVFPPVQEDVGPLEADFIKSSWVSTGPSPICGTALSLCCRTKDFCLVQWGGDWCLLHDCSGFAQRVYSHKWLEQAEKEGSKIIPAACFCSGTAIVIGNSKCCRKLKAEEKWLNCEIENTTRVFSVAAGGEVSVALC